MSMKNLGKRKGFINRHIEGMPKQQCKVKVVTNDVGCENIFICEWEPFDRLRHRENYAERGYLGTVKIIEGRYKGIGFHAWEHSNSEFVWYAVLDNNN